MATFEMVKQGAYRMRASAQYRGDYVEENVFRVNGRKFEATRISWADGEVTVTVRPFGKTTVLHEWRGRRAPLA